MNNLLILTKYNFISFVGLFKGKKKQKSSKSALYSLLIYAVFLIAMYSLSAYSTFEGLPPEICLFNAAITTTSVCLILGLMRSATKQKSNDSDLLLSLPISKQAIVISKAISKYLFDLFFCIALLMPYVVIYFVIIQFSLSMLMTGILICFLLPFLSVGVGYIASFFMNLLFSNRKNANLYKSIFSIGLFIVVMALMLSKSLFFGTKKANDFVSFMSDRPLSYLLVKILFNHKFLDIVKLISITIVPFAIGILLFSINYGKTNIGYKSKKTTLNFRNSTSEFKGLLKKEISNYFSSPVWVTNTIIAPIGMLSLVILIPIFGLDKISTLINSIGSANEAYYMFALILCMLISTCLISCCTISYEGKNLWILKTSPLKEKNIFLSKVCLSFILIIPTLLICTTTLSIMLKIGLLGFLIITGIPLIFSIAISFIGLLINLKNPKLDWKDEAQIVKQSSSSLITMFIGFIIAFLPLVLLLSFSSIPVMLLIVLTLIVDIILALSSIFLTFTYGIKLFRKL